MSEELLSKQALKSQETKRKIYEAGFALLKREGYDALSIKRICMEAGVSNGSFYHHFATKDDLLSMYIEAFPSVDKKYLKKPKDAAMVKAGVLAVYKAYARFAKELGLDFISAYYVPNNQALNPVTRVVRNYPVDIVTQYVSLGLRLGVIHIDVPLEAFATDVRMLIIGNMFEWCLRSGEVDLEENLTRSMGRYLEATIHDV